MTLQSLALLGHVLICAMIIGLVLLQKGKGADAGAAFGAGASGTVFGAKGSTNFLSRSTAVLATLFFLSSLGLTYLGANRPVSQSMMDGTNTPGVEMSSARPADEESAESIDALPILPELEDFGDAELLPPEAGEE